MMLPTRVLHVLDHSLPHLSGYSVRSRYLMGAQRMWNIAPVAVTSPKHGPENGCEEIDGIRYFRTPACPERVARYPVIAELRLMQRLGAQVSEIVRDERIQLVHAHSPVLNGIPALWAARRAGIPVAYEIRAFWEDAAVDHGTHREGSPRYRAIRALESWLIRRVDAVGVISQGLATEVASRGIPATKIYHSPNGVDTELFQPAARDAEIVQRWDLRGKVVLGFIGSFYRYEGLDIFVQAFAKLANEVPNTCALLIGTGEATDALREDVRRLGMESRVVFAGRIAHEDTRRCYSVCDVLVYPRKSMRLTELVTPLKPLEAMAAGKAVVVSDIGGLRELVRDRDTGMLFPAGDSDALAQILRELVQYPDVRAALGQNARRFVCQEREWNRLASVYSDTYSRLLNGNRSLGQ